MESLKILFFLENQNLQTGIETLLYKTRNGFISRELLNMRRELKFPYMNRMARIICRRRKKSLALERLN